MTEINKVTAGDSIRQALTAPNWNELVDGNLRSKQGQNAQLSEFARHFRQSGIVLIKNTTPNDLPRNHILGIDLSPLIDPDESLLDWKNDPAFIGVVPTEEDHLSRFVVLLDPIPKGGLGRAWVSGAAKARVVIDDTDHRCCDVDDEQTNTLRSSTQGGATILTKQHPDSTGEMWCDIRLADCSGGQQGGTVNNQSSGSRLSLGCNPDPGFEVFPFDNILASTSGNRFFLAGNQITITDGGPLVLAYKVLAVRLGRDGQGTDDSFETILAYQRGGAGDFIFMPGSTSYGLIDDVDEICDNPQRQRKTTYEAAAVCPMLYFSAKDGDVIRLEVARLAGTQTLIFPSIEFTFMGFTNRCSFLTLEFK